MPAAQSFQVTVVGANGSRTMRSTSRSKLTLRGEKAREARRILVRGVDYAGKPGPQRTASVRRR
jgi:hypothetical protein